MNCWLCKRTTYSGYRNPFKQESELCAECHRCVEEFFDEEKPSAARLFHELCQKSGLSILQLEEFWLDSRIAAVEKVSAAAHKFLSERCNLDLVLKLLAKSQGLP